MIPRKLAQPAFLKNRVHSYAPMMGELTQQMLARWRPGQAVDIHFEFSSLTSAIALKTLFGLDDRYRALLYGAAAVGFLTLTATPRLLASSAGTAAWIALLAGVVMALLAVVRYARSY